ncbi:MAG TPA: penicillin-binding protein 2 [Methyloceanibacter sp.]|nr:penicillin-binding protein 2 [Methyloceanibacter sp.]
MKPRDFRPMLRRGVSWRTLLIGSANTTPRDQDKKLRNRFSRRALLIGAGQVGLFGLLTWRLRQLQIKDSSEYRLLSDENRLSFQLVAPMRGTIYDRFGAEIAKDQENLRVIVVPVFCKNLAASLDAISTVAPVSPADRDRVLRAARRQNHYFPILVSEGLSWREFGLLNVLAPQLAGVQTDRASYRHYTRARSVAHVVGYVGMAGKGEIDQDKVMRIPGFRIGKTGIEKGLDPELRGKPGSIQYEVDAHGRIVRKLGSTPSEPGRDVVLTLDRDMQAFALDRLAGYRRASLVALDVTTGGVLIMVSNPSFDTNELAFKPDPKIWTDLVKGSDEPLNNRAAAGLYPPGSTFKVVTALAGLTASVIKPEEHIVCKGAYPFGGHIFHCWKPSGHGPIALHDAIKKSCDCYFYETVHRLGIDKLAVTGRALGLGQIYDCGLAGLKQGIMPDTAWKRATLDQPWYPGETISCGIGQGYVSATPLQLAVVVARIASGKSIVPSFLCSHANETQAPPAALSIDPGYLQMVRDGMSGVVNEEGGTATRSALKIPGVLMAGKTGTAQSFGKGAKRQPTGWEAQPHSLFIAFAPVGAPRYAICCVVEHGGYGAQAAAPVVHDVMTELLQRDPASKPVFVANRQPGSAPAMADAGNAQ